MRTLKEQLIYLINGWDSIPIRIKQDGKWRMVYLSEVEDGIHILDWIMNNKGRFWK